MAVVHRVQGFSDESAHLIFHIIVDQVNPFAEGEFVVVEYTDRVNDARA